MSKRKSTLYDILKIHKVEKMKRKEEKRVQGILYYCNLCLDKMSMTTKGRFLCISKGSKGRGNYELMYG